jgi:hypothetical protein
MPLCRRSTGIVAVFSKSLQKRFLDNLDKNTIRITVMIIPVVITISGKADMLLLLQPEKKKIE